MRETLTFFSRMRRSMKKLFKPSTVQFCRFILSLAIFTFYFSCFSSGFVLIHAFFPKLFRISFFTLLTKIFLNKQFLSNFIFWKQSNFYRKDCLFHFFQNKLTKYFVDWVFSLLRLVLPWKFVNKTDGTAVCFSHHRKA